MALAVEFGNGGTSAQKVLLEGADGYAGDDVALNGGGVTTTAPDDGLAGNVIPTDPIEVESVAVPGGGTGSGGSVDVGFDASQNLFSFAVTTGWNSVKNVRATSDGAADIVLTNFVHADVYLGGSGDSEVRIDNVKRGNVETGSGNDTIAISLATNDSSWQNALSVDSGAGNDSIVFSRGTATGSARTVDGRFTSVTIDAGAGNDVIDLSGLNLREAVVIGGSGNDTITGSDGVDIFVYGSGDTGNDTIIDFDLDEDEIRLDDGVEIAETIETVSGNTILVLSNDAQITLIGVTGYGGETVEAA